MAALMQRKLDCRNWRLVLTGHSLGAGAAALIALHLRGRFSSETPPLAGIPPKEPASTASQGF